MQSIINDFIKAGYFKSPNNIWAYNGVCVYPGGPGIFGAPILHEIWIMESALIQIIHTFNENVLKTFYSFEETAKFLMENGLKSEGGCLLKDNWN